MIHKHCYTCIRTTAKLTHNALGRIVMAVHPDGRLAVLCEHRFKGVTVQFYNAAGTIVSPPMKFATPQEGRAYVTSCFPLEQCEWCEVPASEKDPVAYAMTLLLGRKIEVQVPPRTVGVFISDQQKPPAESSALRWETRGPLE